MRFTTEKEDQQWLADHDIQGEIAASVLMICEFCDTVTGTVELTDGTRHRGKKNRDHQTCGVCDREVRSWARGILRAKSDTEKAHDRYYKRFLRDPGKIKVSFTLPDGTVLHGPQKKLP